MLRLNRVRVQKNQIFQKLSICFQDKLYNLDQIVRCSEEREKERGRERNEKKRKRKKKMIWNRLAVENERYRSLYDPNEFYYYCYNDGACRNLRTL